MIVCEDWGPARSLEVDDGVSSLSREPLHRRGALGVLEPVANPGAWAFPSKGQHNIIAVLAGEHRHGREDTPKRGARGQSSSFLGPASNTFI